MMTEQEKAIAKQQDYEANVFAVCLLIPKDKLIEELNKDGGMDLGDAKSTRLKSICKKFGVSESALLFRLSLINGK